MKAYLEKMLHEKIEVSEFNCVNELPIYLKNSYCFSIIKISDYECVFAKSKEVMPFLKLSKQYQTMQRVFSQVYCVLLFDDMSKYTFDKLIENGIPFVLNQKQIYLPKLGMILSQQKSKSISNISEISPSTQKLLLTAIYKKWDRLSLSDIARSLKLSKTTISRCFNELDALELTLVKKSDNYRSFVWEKDARELWNLVLPILHNPVVKQYHIRDLYYSHYLKLGGMSALSYYSNISDNAYKTFVVDKSDIEKSLSDKKIYLSDNGEVPGIALQILEYHLDYLDNKAVDPLSAILSIALEDKSDPRIEEAIDNVIEGVFKQ